MKDIVMEAKDLTKKYKEAVVLDHINLQLEKGKIYGFIGRNGAGKTTFLRLITGLAFPTCGTLALWGKSGTQELQTQRKRIGCMIETPALFPSLSAHQNMEVQRLQRGIPDKTVIDKCLHMVHLEDTGKKAVRNFSLGMRQRLGIAAALLNMPEFLILDEPINGLDPAGIAEIRNLLKHLNQEYGMTILISSHILEELSKLATDYGIINNGALLQEITREELLSKCSEKITLTVDNPTKAVPVLDKMGFVHYMIVDKNHIDVYERLNDSAALNTALVTAGVSVAQLAVTGMELETYFLSITGGATNV